MEERGGFEMRLQDIFGISFLVIGIIFYSKSIEYGICWKQLILSLLIMLLGIIICLEKQNEENLK